MASTLLASWCVTCQSPAKRKAGFWTFLLSNVLWVAWGLGSAAPALVVLQLCLAALNIRGVWKARAAEKESRSAGAVRQPAAAQPPAASTRPASAGARNGALED